MEKIENISKEIKPPQRNRRCKEDPKGNFRFEKYNK